MNPNLHEALRRSQYDVMGHERFRVEAPLSSSDCIDEGRDLYIDEGQIQDRENAYEKTLERWFE